MKIEVVEFMKYLQDVARLCAEDYGHLCEGAARYTEVGVSVGLGFYVVYRWAWSRVLCDISKWAWLLASGPCSPPYLCMDSY